MRRRIMRRSRAERRSNTVKKKARGVRLKKQHGIDITTRMCSCPMCKPWKYKFENEKEKYKYDIKVD